MADAIGAAIEELKQRIDAKVAELKAHPALDDIGKLRVTLNALEDLEGLPRTQLATLLGFVSDGDDDEGDVKRIVRFDEFVGITALEAAKRYLKKRKDARPFDEIVRAIQAGGGRLDSEEDLRTGLTRSTLDLVKIGDRFGTLENYPHIRRGGKRRRTASVQGEAEGTNGTEDADKNEAVSE